METSLLQLITKSLVSSEVAGSGIWNNCCPQFDLFS